MVSGGWSSRVLVATFLAPVVFAAALPLAQPAQATVPCRSGGDGTVADPCLIQSVADLVWLRSDSTLWNAYFEQTANIDLAGTTWTSPIGSSTDPFAGTYDGGRFTISGLTVEVVTTGALAHGGLFGVIGTAGSVSDLTLTDASVSVRAGTSASLVRVEAFAGAVVGDNAGTLTNVQATNLSVEATGEARGFDGTNYYQAFTYAGGVAGRNTGTISGAYATGSANALALSQASQVRAGGIAGALEFSGIGTPLIEKAFAHVDVLASDTNPESDAYAGGLVGSTGGLTEIRDSAARGSATAEGSYAAYSGGVVGSNNVDMEKVYATGAVSIPAAAFQFTGGLFGNSGAVSATGSFWNTETANTLNAVGDGGPVLGITDSTTAGMTDAATYRSVGWDVADGYSVSALWSWCPAVNDGYPLLSAFFPPEGCGTTGDGTVAPAPPILIQQAVPLPESGNCTDVVDTDFAYGTDLAGGWQKGWEPWAGPVGVGGYACVRVLVKQPSKPWRVDNSGL